MMKKLLIFLLSLVVVVVIAAVIALAALNNMIAAAIEKGGTYALGVETKLDSASLSVLGGSFHMSGLAVDNPEGFAAEEFFTLGDGGVAVSLVSLTGDVVTAPYLRLNDVSLSLEKKEGKTNYGVILDSLKRFESDEKKDDPAKPKEPGKKFKIEELTIRNVTVHADLLPAGGELTRVQATIDEIVLNHVGSDRGVPMGDLAGIVLKAVLSVVAQKSGDVFPADIVGDLKGRLANLDAIPELGVQLGENFGDAAKKALEEGGKAVNDAAEKAGKQVEDAIKDINPFGKKGSKDGGGGG